MAEQYLSSWKDVFFEFKTHTQTQMNLLAERSLDEIRTLVVEERRKCQAKENHEESGFEEAMGVLDLIENVVDEWVNIQRGWDRCRLYFVTETMKKRFAKVTEDFTIAEEHYRKIVSSCLENPNVLIFCRSVNILSEFNHLKRNFETIALQLEHDLMQIRLTFPRFFFVSNDQLVEILSVSDISQLKPLLRGLFKAVNDLVWDKQLNVLGMLSPESEYVPWPKPLAWSDSNIFIELWLSDIEAMMHKAVWDHTKKARRSYPECDRRQWAVSWPCMVVLCVSQIFWTSEAEQAISAGRGRGLLGFNKKCNQQLEEIIVMLRRTLSDLERRSIETLIVTEVHARDVSSKLVEDSVSSVSEFAWLAQLRYSWEAENVHCSLLCVRREYGYEYLGVESRIVATPLTDRYYRTLMCALHSNLGGSLEGPAGSGKTETVKGLSQAMALNFCCVNCSDGIDILMIAKFFRGVVCSGCWICLDEFNRINLEVLTIVAQQMLCIQSALKSQSSEIEFEGSRLKLNPACAIFITMNPGYAGRTGIPDALNASFRPVQMAIPEYEYLVEIMLIKFGFTQALPLSRKIGAIFKLSVQQLSSQTHYDFGLRSIMLILGAAGKIKKLYPGIEEENVVLWASSQIFMPKLIAEDLVLYHQILEGLFPGLEQPQYDHTHLLSALAFACEHHNLTPSPYFSHKALELYEILSVKDCILLVGETYGGKTSSYVALSEALGTMSDHGRKNANKVQVSVLNPSSVTVAELFGYFDADTSIWIEGILTKIFRDLNSYEENGRGWMVIDGHVDMMWGEFLYTVMDQNKSLCLANGEIIKMQSSFSLIIETKDLSYAPPAFVSRCGNVFYDPALMSLDTFQNSWLRSLPDIISDSHRDFIQMLFRQVVLPCLKFMRSETEEIYPSCDNSLVWSTMKLFDLLILDEGFKRLLKFAPDDAVLTRIEGIFLFSVIWSICCTAKNSGRLKFDRFFRSLLLCSEHGQQEEKKFKPLSQIPDPNSIFHYYFHPERAEWIRWTSMISANTLDATRTSQDIFVQTVDSVTVFYWLNLHSERTWNQSSHHKMPLMLVGPAAGKTTTINRYLSHHLESSAFFSLSMHFTEQTSSRQTQEAIQSKLVEKEKGIFGPVGSKRCLVFIDDVNMAPMHRYGARPPIELLRQYFCQRGWYDHSTRCLQEITDVNLVCAMGELSGTRGLLPRRFVRWFHVIGVAGFDEEAIFSIYRAIACIQGNLMEAPSILTEMTESIVRATVLVYSQCVELFRPSAANPHYVFRTSDIGRVVAGAAFKACPVEKESAVRLWIHETSREFFDRLSSDKDRIIFCDIMHDITKQCFALDLDRLTKHLEVPNSENLRYVRLRRLCFGDFQLGANYSYREFMNPDDVLDKARLILTEQVCKAYPVPPILFQYMIENTLHLSRLLRTSGGSALLLGKAATGRRICTKLAAYIFDMKIVEIEPTSKGFKRSEWLESIKCALLSAGAESKKTVLYFADRQIHTNNILEDLGQLFRKSDYYYSSFFTEEDITEMVFKQKSSQSVDWFRFMEQCTPNLHIVVSLKEQGAQLAETLQQNPFLTSCCTMKWFVEWPIDSFLSVAKELIPQSEVGEGAWISCQEVSAKMHQTALSLSRTFTNETFQSVEVNPNMFLDFMYHFTTLLSIQKKSVDSQMERCLSALEILSNLNILYSNDAFAHSDQQTEMAHSDQRTENGPVVQERLSRLTSLLSGEIGRLKLAANTFEVRKADLIGDLLLAAGYVTYLGAFSKHSRDKVLSSWIGIIHDSGLRCGREFDFNSRMADSTKIQEWLDQGLKPDLHSISNAIILVTHRRTPYCIDPQGQAGKWIRMMESKNDLRVIASSDPRYLSILQLCSSSSKPVLLEHESGDLDPALYSVLLKEQFLSLGSSISNEGIPKDFRMYITSNNAKPHLTQLTTCKVAVINFVLSEEALEEQLRTVVYLEKNSDLEAQKRLLINRATRNSISLLDLEQSMLNVGMHEEGKVMDYDVAVAFFEKIATNVQEIEHTQDQLHRIEAQICEIQHSYQRFAKRTSVIYFAMMSLSQLNVMYQYSLPWFVSLLIQYLQNPHASPNNVSDVANLEQNCLQFFFRIVCRSLYEQDRLLFSFLLCTRLMKSAGKLQDKELYFCITGCNDLLETQGSPFQQWLSDKSWQRVLSASELRATFNLSDDIKLNQDGWRQFCESSDLNLKYPGSWAESSSWTKLLIARALREDKMFSAIKCFVSEGIGQQSKEVYSIADCFADSNPCTPIIIIFSPDYDPVAEIQFLARSLCFSSGMQSLVLGQGQGPLADNLIRRAYSAGGWVLLQNCHLYPSWMPVLEHICMNFEQKSANENFLLWLTSQMTSFFPTSVLKNGLKMIYSPPSGLQSTLKRILSSEINWDEDLLSPSKDAIKVKKLFIAMVCFHCLIMERQSYGPVGWNLLYNFSISDLKISLDQVKPVLENYEGHYFRILHYIIGECTYGGRVRDEQDRRYLLQTLADFIQSDTALDGVGGIVTLLRSNFPQGDFSNHDLKIFLDLIPETQSAQLVGLHENGDIIKDLRSSNEICQKMISMLCFGIDDDMTSETKSFEKKLTEILTLLPEQFDSALAQKSFPIGNDSLNIVLIREIKRFNTLIVKIRSSVTNIKDTLNGLSLTTHDNEGVEMALRNGNVPPSWLRMSYQSSKNIAYYFSDLVLRINFLQKWLDEGQPVIFWLSAFFSPSAFLTGVLHNHARKWSISFCNLSFDHAIMKEERTSQKPHNGVYVRGLFCGAGLWNSNDDLLDEALLGVLSSPMPTIWFIPKDQLCPSTEWCEEDRDQHGRPLAAGVYYCPLYPALQDRKIICHVALPTNKPQSHWIRRGTALFLTQDN